ncbi:MAG: hypothetical protein ABJA62_02370 [Luteimonas sp.]
MALRALGVLALISAIASDLPRTLAWLGGGAALAMGMWWAQREMSRPTQSIVIAGDGRTTVDGAAVEHFGVQWRATLAFVRWRDAQGRWQRRSFWPDTLSAPQRRELRLAITQGPGTPKPSAMAH